MAPALLTRTCLLFAGLLTALGCQPQRNRGTETYVTGLRLLAIKAEPPEVASGQTSTLTALAIDTMGRPIDIAWSYCEAVPAEGQRFNTDCVTSSMADYLHPLASGLSTSIVMPAVDAAVLGMPDGTGGVYLPIRAVVTAGTDTLTAIYHLRVAMAAAPNTNPELTGMYQVMVGAGPADGGSPGDGGCTADGGSAASTCANGSDLLTWIDAATPPVVRSGDKLTLRALFTTASAESYTTQGPSRDGGTSQPRMRTEPLDVAWYTTGGTIGGSFGGGMGGPMGGPMGGRGNSDAVLTLDSNLPASGGTIDLWAVGRDNRGGADYLHRTLSLQ